MSAICPECDSAIDLEAADVDVGDELTCSECGSLLRVANDSPVELEVADDLDEDEEDDDDDEEESEDEDELDEDEDEDEDGHGDED